ncbi:MAG TPA: pilus assembly PilX N-terminal domain-containing protein [Burkholderiaceae bacterium]|nr:pilus assembly PilX N-terminal domain-containing protein [Burkholderiaceae bacterium]
MKPRQAMPRVQAGKAGPAYAGTAQRGITIVVTLIFLALISFVVITAYRLSGQQLALVGNAQGRSQARAAADYAIEETVSSLDFVKRPDYVATKVVQVDVLGDGATKLGVTMARPSCYRVRTVKSNELDLSKATDRSCLASTAGAGGALVEGGGGVTAGDSLCADTEWALSASVSDAVTGTNLTVNQGVSLRVDQVDATSNCS